MKSRRGFLAATAALFSRFTARAQRSATRVEILARHPLAGAMAGMEATLVAVTIPPGQGSSPHRHPGFVLGYVLEGELGFAIDGAAPRTIQAGGTFFEPEGAHHTGSASARPDAPVKLLAFMVAKQGSPVTLPE